MKDLYKKTKKMNKHFNKKKPKTKNQKKQKIKKYNKHAYTLQLNWEK